MSFFEDVALRFTGKDGGLAAQFKRVSADLTAFEKNAKSAATAVQGTFSQLKNVVATVALGAAVKQIVDFADGIVKVNASTGIAIAKVQELQFVAGQADVEFGSLTTGIAKLQRALVNADDGQKAAKESLKALGITTREFFSLKPDQQFERVAVSISNIEDPARRTNAAMDLFGRAGAELLPVLTALGKESTAIAVKFDQLGGPVSDKAIQNLDEMGDAASATGLAVKSLGAELLGLAAPAITAALEGITHFFAGLRIAAVGGTNEIVNLDDDIRDLQSQLDSRFGIYGVSLLSDEMFRDLTRQIRAKKHELDQLLGLGTAFAEPRIPKNLGISQDELMRAASAPLLALKIPRDKDEIKEEDRLIRQQKFDNMANLAQLEINEKIKLHAKLAMLDDTKLQKDLERERFIITEKLKITTEFEDFLASVRQTFRLKEIKLEEIKNQSIFGLATEAFGFLARENSKFAKIQQGIAIAQTVYATATGIMKAFQTLPWPANLAAAAKVAFTGALQIAKIKATSPNGGSGSAPSFSSSGGGTVAQAPPTNDPVGPNAQRGTTVYISGFISKDIVDQMIDGLRDGFDRDVIVIPTNSLQAQTIRGQ